jgi:hypothetical protein
MLALMVLVAPAPTERDADGRDEILALLRAGSGSRPRFDPGLGGGLRAWLEDAASLIVLARGEESAPLHLGTRAFAGDRGRAGATVGSGDLITPTLVHALFRQLVVTGSVGDPLSDALHAVRVTGGRDDVIREIERLGVRDRQELAARVGRHVEQLRRLLPPLQPVWLPRTAERVSVPLAGGRVVLHGVFDLLIGAPEPDAAALCAVALTTSGAWSLARQRLHLLALLETIRSGAPPFRVGLLHSGEGRYGVEDVTEEHLRAVAAHVAGRLTELAQGTDDPH